MRPPPPERASVSSTRTCLPLFERDRAAQGDIAEMADPVTPNSTSNPVGHDEAIAGIEQPAEMQT